MKSKVNWFSGQEILTEDMGHLNDGYAHADHRLERDFWTDGVIKDPNGLSNMAVTVDALTTNLINVGWGIGYADGYRIAIEADVVYSSSNPTATTNGVCTPQSTGNKAIPLASYAAGQSNFVWAEYLEVSRTNPTEISAYDGSRHYPFADHGYQIIVNTTNPPGNPVGLNHALFLGTVFGQGNGVPLVAAPTGLCQTQEQYVSLVPQDAIGTLNIRDGSVTPAKMVLTGNFTFNGICASTIIGSSNVTVPLYPLLPTSAPSRQYSRYTGFDLAMGKGIFTSTFDQNYNLAFITLHGDITGTITPVYDGLSNIVQMNEVIDALSVSHIVTYQTVNGASLVRSIKENGA